jgi:hypothetical protein
MWIKETRNADIISVCLFTSAFRRPNHLTDVGFAVFTAVTMVSCSEFWRHVKSYLDDNVSEKHHVSVFRDEMTMLEVEVFI